MTVGLKSLRKDLKDIQVRLRKLGFEFLCAPGGFHIKRIGFDDSLPSSYISISSVTKAINVSVHKNVNVYKVEFICEPCRISGGNSYMPLDVAEEVCKYWKKAIDECKYFNSLQIVGTLDDFNYCMNDIQNKSRI